MIDRLPILALLVLASLPAPSALGAAAPTTRNYSVTSFDRIRIDGPYKVELRTNVSPFARATGSPLSLDGLSIGVEGRTLVVRRGSGGWGGYSGESRGPVTISVGTPDLRNAWINGAGALSVDRVRGLSFDLAIQGSGMATLEQVDVDQFKAGISGSGSIRMSGKVAKLTATVRGTSTFDGDALQVKDAVIGAEGPSTVRTTVTNSAKVDALGLASVNLAGRPSCEVNAKGSATVSGCKH